MARATSISANPRNPKALGPVGFSRLSSRIQRRPPRPIDGTWHRTLGRLSVSRCYVEQLGEHRLEAAVTTDICGKNDSHAVRLDNEAVEAIRKARLHRKVGTAIFFESN